MHLKNVTDHVEALKTYFAPKRCHFTVKKIQIGQVVEKPLFCRAVKIEIRTIKPQGEESSWPNLTKKIPSVNILEMCSPWAASRVSSFVNVYRNRQERGGPLKVSFKKVGFFFVLNMSRQVLVDDLNVMILFV